MSDFKSCLIEEHAQLEEKLNKLNDFNQSEKVNAIDPAQKYRPGAPFHAGIRHEKGLRLW